MRIIHQTALILTLLSSLGLISGCTNNTLSKLASKASNVGQNGANNVIINYGTYKIANVAVGSTPASADAGYPVTITFDTSTSTTSISSSCTVDTGAAPCACKFSWNEINNTSGSPVTIGRAYFSNVTSIAGAQIGCTTPPSATWSTDISDNTSITISVVPANSSTTSNPNTFTVTPYAFTKNQSNLTGNFTDSMGRSFVNVLRYSCYEQRQRGLSLVNKVSSQTITNINTFNFLVSNKFCLRNAAGTVKGGDGCDSVVGPADYSAQSYYYNMYIRDSESGSANPGNALFVCPTVTEALNQQAGNPATQGKFWPMDSSFALSLGKTSDFSVGIVAHTKTTNAGDPAAKNTACDGTTSETPEANSLISSCLGFAAKTNVNGTCPKITVNQVSGSCPTGSFLSGSTCIMPTYRLRRFVATYPSIYDTDGNILSGEAQRIDTVYVLDRPVLDGSGNILMDSNGSPYSMLGPKPCPYAFFDSSDVTGAGQGYHGTNHSGWDKKNVDNIHFPDQDTGSGYTGTCAAILPSVDVAANTVKLTTLTPATRQYIRPIRSWAPHYEEDTSFQACAPQSNPLRDPPLHFAKYVDPVTSKTNVAWCAETYPTKNDNAAKYPAAILSTSHTGASDRTVVNPSTGVTWTKFPLLAPEAEVKDALLADASFACKMTYDNGGGKVNSANFSMGDNPTGVCCSNVTVTNPGDTAHLEPSAAPASTACASPNY